MFSDIVKSPAISIVDDGRTIELSDTVPDPHFTLACASVRLDDRGGITGGQHIWQFKIEKSHGYVAVGLVSNPMAELDCMMGSYDSNTCSWQGNGEAWQNGNCYHDSTHTFQDDDILEICLDMDKGLAALRHPPPLL